MAESETKASFRPNRKIASLVCYVVYINRFGCSLLLSNKANKPRLEKSNKTNNISLMR